jgi:D-alanine-D-alanine ligase
MKKIKVGILYGGKSDEHDVSIMSAKNVFAAIDKSKYDPKLLYVKRDGSFNLGSLSKFDVIFPLIHGINGEDGTASGLLRFVGVSFVGADVLGSAVGMDKDVMKRLLKEAGLPIANFVTVRSMQELDVNKIVKILGLPLFIKPANQGSSVGVAKVKSKEDLGKAVRNAFKFDKKVLIEEFVKGREIECAVFGNRKPKVSLPGEIITTAEFYDYKAKYFDAQATRLEIPAKLSLLQIKAAQKLALETYRVLECEGFARVDLFFTGKKFLVNEINTIPGFTNSSMYPKLWEKSGIKYKDLITKLIELALEK